MHIVDLAAGVSPAGCFRYPAIAVQLVEPSVRIRLQNTAEACKMALRVTGSSLQFLYQQSQKLFADSADEAERPMPERYLTADTEGFRVLYGRFWLYGSGIESHRK